MMRLAAFLALLLGGGALAEPPVDVERKPAPAAKAKAKAKPAARAKTPARPAWAELTVDQQRTLSPLKADWDSLDTERRRKWLGVAKRYPNMTAQGQERVQRRMQIWANLSPEQRRQARENYKRIIVKAPPAKRANVRQQWAAYQQLSPQERDTLLQGDKKRR